MQTSGRRAKLQFSITADGLCLSSKLSFFSSSSSSNSTFLLAFSSRSLKEKKIPHVCSVSDELRNNGCNQAQWNALTSASL